MGWPAAGQPPQPEPVCQQMALAQQAWHTLLRRSSPSRLPRADWEGQQSWERPRTVVRGRRERSPAPRSPLQPCRRGWREVASLLPPAIAAGQVPPRCWCWSFFGWGIRVAKICRKNKLQKEMRPLHGGDRKNATRQVSTQQYHPR